MEGKCLAQGPNATAREAEIPEAFSGMENSLHSLNEALGDLCNRLVPVSRNEPPKEPPNKAPTPVENTPVGTRIRELQGGVTQLTLKIRDQITRLEI